MANMEYIRCPHCEIEFQSVNFNDAGYSLDACIVCGHTAEEYWNPVEDEN